MWLVVCWLVSRQSSGHNVVVLDETSGEVLESRVFNTESDRDSGQHLATFLTELPTGRVVVIVVQNTGKYVDHTVQH